MADDLLDAAETLRSGIERLRADNALLQRALDQKPPVDIGGPRILQDALNNKPGWRSEARELLGKATPKACAYEPCRKLFPRGGKRRKYCSDECRFKDR